VDFPFPHFRGPQEVPISPLFDPLPSNHTSQHDTQSSSNQTQPRPKRVLFASEVDEEEFYPTNFPSSCSWALSPEPFGGALCPAVKEPAGALCPTVNEPIGEVLCPTVNRPTEEALCPAVSKLMEGVQSETSSVSLPRSQTEPLQAAVVVSLL